MPAALIFPAAALALAACGSGGQAPTASGTPNAGASGASGGPVVTTATAPGVGTVLVTSGGRTLYQATAPCTGGCLRVWQPLTLPPGTATPGGARGVTGLTAASQGGHMQVAYRGHLLYTFTGDTKPGEVNGNGMHSFGGRWTAATLSSAASRATSPRTSPSPATSPPATTAPGSGGYGDTDHDGDCRPGYGDTDHDGDCGPGPMGPGHGPG